MEQGGLTGGIALLPADLSKGSLTQQPRSETGGQQPRPWIARIDFPPSVSSRFYFLILRNFLDPNCPCLFDLSARFSQSRSRKSAQDDKWSFCLTAGTLCAANQERQ